jgi:hypothetical protein
MFRPGYRAEAVRLAADMKLKIVGPLEACAPRICWARTWRSSSAPSS